MKNKEQMSFDEIVDDLANGTKIDIEYPNRDKLLNDLGFSGAYVRNAYGLWHSSPLTENWRTNPSSRDIRNGIDYSKDHPDQISCDIIKAHVQQIFQKENNGNY